MRKLLPGIAVVACLALAQDEVARAGIVYEFVNYEGVAGLDMKIDGTITIADSAVFGDGLQASEIDALDLTITKPSLAMPVPVHFDSATQMIDYTIIDVLIDATSIYIQVPPQGEGGGAMVVRRPGTVIPTVDTEAAWGASRDAADMVQSIILFIPLADGTTGAGIPQSGTPYGNPLVIARATATPVPEPSTFALFAVGGLALAGYARRQRGRQAA